MNERSLRVLEFTKIRAQLAQYCVSDMGRALCDALTPSNRLEDVLRMQQETEEAHSLLSYLGGTPMLSFSDVHASLHLAQIGSSLSPRALMEIGASLRAARAARLACQILCGEQPLKFYGSLIGRIYQRHVASHNFTDHGADQRIMGAA